MRAAGDVRDRVVLVQGAGMLGLTAAAMARHAHAREVIVSDVDEQRLAWAERFGATQTVLIEPDGSELTNVVSRATGGRGVDVALEMSGSVSAIEDGLARLRIGARYILVGTVFPTRDLALQPELLVRRLLRIEGVHNYSPVDLIHAVEFLNATQAEYPFAELVTRRFPLVEADAAFRFAIETKAPRVAVVPSGA
jgi:alcohol dehydrogenase